VRSAVYKVIPLERLIDNLDNWNQQVRIWSANILGDLRETEAAAELTDVKTYGDVATSQACARALDKISLGR